LLLGCASQTVARYDFESDNVHAREIASGGIENTMNVSGNHKFLLALMACACGSVAESDPAFWDKTADLGGKNFDFGAAMGGPGAAPGTGGTPVDPNPNSGGVVAAGGFAPAGGAGAVVGSGAAAGAGGAGGAGGASGPEASWAAAASRSQAESPDPGAARWCPQGRASFRSP
jgi:hypothetical protein